MKEAYGGIVSFVFIIIFLVIVIGVLGLVVSYTKAFKMKNMVISIIEEYEGSGCRPELNSSESYDSACRSRITDAAKELGYSPASLKCNNGTTASREGLYCYSVENIGDNKIIFKVVTQIDLSFPIIEKMMGISFFQVSGDTMPIEIPADLG